MTNISANNNLGCKPPQDEKSSVTVSKGLALKSVNAPLVELEVLFGNESFPAGSTVFIRRPAQPLEVLDVGGVQVALVDALKVLFRSAPPPGPREGIATGCAMCKYFINCPGCGRGS